MSWLSDRWRGRARGKAQAAAAPAQREVDAFRAALAAGDHDRARQASLALEQLPFDSAQVQVLRAQLAYAGDGLDAAEAHLRDALARLPALAEAHAWLAAVCMQRGRAADALAHAQTAERLGPGSAQTRNLIGAIHTEQGDLPAAMRAFAAAVELEPGDPLGHANLLSVAQKLRDWPLAERHGRALTVLAPDDEFGWRGLGNGLSGQGEYAQAWPAFERGLACANAGADLHHDFANALFYSGDVERARVQFAAALEINPAAHESRHLLANCRLIIDGASAGAWRDYEARQHRYPLHFRERAPRWDGQPCPGRRLMVYSEQGIGDIVLFARHLAALRDSAADVLFQVPPPLLRLLRHSGEHFGWGIRHWIASVDPVGPDRAPFDVEVPLLSLPLLLGTKPARTARAYLAVPDALRRQWAEQLPVRQPGHLRVGVVWAGNPARSDDAMRSIPTAALAPLASVEGVEFVKLQMDARAEYHVDGPLRMIDPTAGIADFADTAAIMLGLDLVLSIDTSAAHLAGALGVPCWVLLSQFRDWRWELGGVDQPWFASLRTFRVDRPRQWQPLVERVAAELRGQRARLLALRGG